jgi:hypothetical protein
MNISRDQTLFLPGKVAKPYEKLLGVIRERVKSIRAAWECLPVSNADAGNKGGSILPNGDQPKA